MSKRVGKQVHVSLGKIKAVAWKVEGVCKKNDEARKATWSPVRKGHGIYNF